MNEYVLCAFSDNTSSKGISWDPRDVGGGDCYATWRVGELCCGGTVLCPCDVAAVGSNQLCGMGVMRQDVLNLAVVDTKKSSPMDLVSMQRKRVQRTRFSLQRNRVQWTRFLCIETEFTGLGFCT